MCLMSEYCIYLYACLLLLFCVYNGFLFICIYIYIPNLELQTMTIVVNGSGPWG